MKRAYVVVDLGFGDSGKGATVDFLCRKLPVDLVCRFSGGSNSGHTVVDADGRTHTFSQWGSGTLAGVPSYLGPRMIIDPVAMKREAEHLVEVGVDNPWKMLKVDHDCLVSTRYHKLSNQIAELLRDKDRHGSCGKGIGETRAYWLRHGEDAVIAEDLITLHTLVRKLRLLQDRLIDQLSKSKIDNPSEEAMQLIQRLLHDNPREVADELQACFANAILWQYTPPMENNDTVVFEGSQGILLDEYHGFPPHNTWSTVTSKHALEMIPADTPTTMIGCIRSYMTRHGEGPFPTHESHMTATIRDPGNPENEWQGKLRCGVLDMHLLKYAISANNGIDGLAVSHLDHAQFTVRTGYKGNESPLAEMIPNIARQTLIGKWLSQAPDSYRSYVGMRGEDEFIETLEQIATVMIKAYGRTAEDRVFTDKWPT